jgi:hypothetical protein
MSDQGKVNITMTVPVSTAYGSAISGEGTVSATLRAVGLLDEETDASTVLGPVQISGTKLGIAAEAISIGDRLKSDADGKLAVVTGDATDNGLTMAVALELAAAEDVLFRVKIL